MLKRLLMAVSVVLAGCGIAWPQGLQVTGAPPYSGTAIGNGLTMTNTMFMAANALLQAGLPMGISEWVKRPAGPIGMAYTFNSTAAHPVGFWIGDGGRGSEC